MSVPAVGNGGVLAAVVGELWKHMEMKNSNYCIVLTIHLSLSGSPLLLSLSIFTPSFSILISTSHGYLQAKMGDSISFTNLSISPRTSAVISTSPLHRVTVKHNDVTVMVVEVTVIRIVKGIITCMYDK